MPVLVTGAESGLGARVLQQLRLSGGQIRAYLDATVADADTAAALRATGCKVALGELDDEGHLEAALAQVHTVAHCWGGPLHDLEAQLNVAGTVASAALGAGVRRLVWVRELAVDATNPYLALLGQIGELFDELPIETVVFAVSLRHGIGDPLTARLAGGWLSGSGVDADAAHAPIDLDDVARAVAVADRQRGTARELHVRLGLRGPEEMSLREFLLRIGAPGLDGPAPVAPPPQWVVDWLSRPDGDGTSSLVPSVAHGVDRVPSSY
ncbi:hypothetical protein BH23ACT10_BH23ACT10_01000 [soil metagenome]